MRNILVYRVLLIGFLFGNVLLNSCKRQYIILPFEYTPGNPSDLIINDPSKIVITGLTYTVNHTERVTSPLRYAFDGDRLTLYHSPWSIDIPPTQFPVIITVTLPDNAPAFDYMLYWPRQVGSNGRITSGELRITTKESPDNFIPVFQMNYGTDAAAKKISIPSQYRGQIKKLMFYITAGAADVVSIQEIEFYNEGLPTEIPDVFTDKTCSELKPGVTLKEVNSISNTVFRNIALSLYDKTYDMRRVAVYKSYINPEVMSKSNKTSTYGLLDNITGIYIAKNEELVVFADDHTNDLILRIIDSEGTFEGQNVNLSAGANKIKANISGLVYLLYHNNSNETVKVNFSSGKVNGYFDITEHKLEDWEGIINSTVANRLDLRGEYAHLIFPTAELKLITRDPVRLLQVYDSIVWLEEEFMGLHKYNRENKNRMLYWCTTEATYMAATAYRTMYNPSTGQLICDYKRVRTTDMWGPAHETGHVNQTRPGFRWNTPDGKSVLGEVSTNVYSMFVQWSFGNNSRLEADNKYVDAFNSFMVNGVKHYEAIGDIDKKYYWEQLVHLWQLELYFSRVKGQTDFYKDLHEQIRINPNPTPGNEPSEFAYLASKVSGYDLTGFFTLYGYEISSEAKDKIANLGNPEPDQPLHYIRDTKVDCFKNNLEIVNGTATKTNLGNPVLFTMSGWSNVVAYEVRVDGVLKYISLSNSFSVSLPDGTITVDAIGGNGEKVLVGF